MITKLFVNQSKVNNLDSLQVFLIDKKFKCFSTDKRTTKILPIRVFNLMVRARQRKNRRKMNKKQEQRILYSEAITFLLEKGIDLQSLNPELAKEYYLSARKLGMRGRQHLPKQYRLFFCRSCKYPLQTSTMRVRLNSAKKQIIYNCTKCGSILRFGYIKENQK